MEFRLPQINASTTDGQMEQMKSFMYQLIEQLNLAINFVNEEDTEATIKSIIANQSKEMSGENAQDTFNSIKALIIKSADIVNAYYETMKVSFDGIYTANSDFGQFQEVTNSRITAASTGIEQIYNDLQHVIAEVSEVLKTQAWIKSGLLETDGQGNPIYGIEVGQKTETGGVETFNKYARFTASGIYFYLPSSTKPIAWLTGTQLFIQDATINGSLNLFGYKLVHIEGGLTFKWVGGDS